MDRIRTASAGLFLFGSTLLAACTATPAPKTADAPPVQLAAYDPGALLYAPAPVALPGCGLTIGLDPRWTLKETEKGTSVSLISSFDSKTSSQLDPHPFRKISVTVTTGIQVLCSPVKAQGVTTKLYTDSYLKVLAKREGILDPLKATPARVAASGSWNRIFYRTRGKHGVLLSVTAYLSVHDGRQRLIIIRTTDPARREPNTFVRHLKPGDTFVYLPEVGAPVPMAAVIQRETRVSREGALYPAFTDAESRAFDSRVAATIR